MCIGSKGYSLPWLDHLKQLSLFEIVENIDKFEASSLSSLIAYKKCVEQRNYFLNSEVASFTVCQIFIKLSCL